MRVYDISEAEGEVFISMEYVDGEDLATLLRRVGRLTVDKAMQIACHLRAGLGAAHDQGVLHRDLKPANIMIDGAGGPGLPISASPRCFASGRAWPMACTPAFMAPELFTGGKPADPQRFVFARAWSVRTIAVTRPFGASADLRVRDATPVRLSAILPEIDARCEQVILQCLAGDPKRRPDSAYAVAAALPGGEALAMALAAGETPSPSMVAAASPSAVLIPRVAMGYLTVALVALFFVVQLADQTFFLPQAGLWSNRRPYWPTKRNRSLPRFGTPRAARSIGRVLRLIVASCSTPRAGDRHRTWEDLPTGQPPAVCYWYRAGSDQLAVPALMGEPSPMARVSDRSRHGDGAVGWSRKAAAIRHDARSHRFFRLAIRPGGLVGVV